MTSCSIGIAYFKAVAVLVKVIVSKGDPGKVARFVVAVIMIENDAGNGSALWLRNF